MTPEVRVAGTPLATIAPVGGIELDVRWPLGGYQLDFDLLLSNRVRPSIVVGNAPCVLTVGGIGAFAGTVSDVNWDDGSVTATGLCRAAETIPALNGTLTATTSTPDTAVDTARTLGWRVTRPASLSSAPLAATDETNSLNMTAALLDAWSNDNGLNWYVDPQGAVRAAADPTAPEVYVLPGAGELSWSVERQATRIVGTWRNSSGRTQVTVVGSGTVVRSVDLTSRGTLTATQASSILTQILSRSSNGSWTDGITVAAEQLTTPGGLHPSLSQVAAMVGRGLMVRLLGHRDPRPGRFALTTDVVIEKAVWSVDDRTITLSPRGTTAGDFAAVVESFGGSVTV